MSMDSKQPPSSPQVRALGEHLGTALDRAARAAEPPDYDQLAAYVDGTLDEVDREIVESWLESDQAMRAEVDDLHALREAMTIPAAPAAERTAATRIASARSTSEAASMPFAGSSPPAVPESAGVLPFERRETAKPGGRRGRFKTATVIMGALAAAAIAATTWLAVRTARVDDGRSRPGFAGTGSEGSQVARQVPPAQRQQQAQQQSEQSRQGSSSQGQPDGPPPVKGPNAGVPQVAANAAAAVRDAGGLISIDAAGTVTGLTSDAATPQMTRLVADALMKGAVPRAAGAATAGLGGRELTLMGGGSRQPSTTRLTPLSPIATVVRTAQPVFRWSAHPGARNYVVTIYGPDFDRVMASPVVTGTSWTATSELKPGVTYQWQVTADTPDGAVRAPAPPAPDARFRVIDPAAGKTLDRDLARAGASQLVKGLLLAQAGVLDEAEEAFEALRAANPDSKRVADLLSRVRDRRLAP
jgi:hypothetical protein